MLDSIVPGFQDGCSPETIRENFHVLTLEQVYGAIAFYLPNQGEVQSAMRERERVEDGFNERHPTAPGFERKLERARERASARRS